MLEHKEIVKILTAEGVNPEHYNREDMRELLADKPIPDKMLDQLIEDLAYCAVDMDSNLYDILDSLSALDMTLKQVAPDTYENIDFFESWCDILGVVVDSLKVCRDNAGRLLELIKKVDFLDAYNLIFTDYKSYFTPEQMEKIKSKALKQFDKDSLYI